jgi:hypothetical protein
MRASYRIYEKVSGGGGVYCDVTSFETSKNYIIISIQDETTFKVQSPAWIESTRELADGVFRLFIPELRKNHGQGKSRYPRP